MNQLHSNISYLKNINSMDNFEWKVGYDKLKSSWKTQKKAQDQLKKQWTAVFKSKSDEIFNTICDNQNLRKKIFESGLSKTEARLDFNDMVKETDDVLFKFIKVE